MAFLATRFPSRHRNLGRRRRGVRAKAFAPDLATVPFLADNLEPEPVCVAYWRRIWVAASAAPQQTATCVLRRLNTEICPVKGPVAVGAGVLSLVAVRLSGSPLGGVLMAGAVRHVPPAAQFRRALSPPAAGSPTCSGAARRPGEVSAPGLAVLLGPCAGWLPPVACPWRGGVPPPAVSRAPAQFSGPQEQDQPRQHRQRASRSLSQERKAPWKPRADPLPLLPCRAGSRRWLSWRSLRAAVPAGTDSSAAPLPLSPIPVSGRLRAKSIRLQSETKH